MYDNAKMQIRERSWEEVSTDLRERLETCGLSNAALSDRSGIDYYAARRLLRGDGLKKRSKNTERLCKFFRIKLQTGTRTKAWDRLEHQLDKLRGAPDEMVQFVTAVIRATAELRRRG